MVFAKTENVSVFTLKFDQDELEVEQCLKRCVSWLLKFVAILVYGFMALPTYPAMPLQLKIKFLIRIL